MALPTAENWSFAEIANEDADRARHLERVSSGELRQQLKEAFTVALRADAVRFAMDSRQNHFQVCRVIIQFPASPLLVDAFFNSRAGYRAHFWALSESGLIFNSSLVEMLVQCIAEHPSSEFEARRITVLGGSQYRSEADVGLTKIPKPFVIRSLVPSVSKIWLCERLVQRDGKPPLDTQMLLAAIGSSKLNVARWDRARNPTTGEIGEGLRAPFPATNAQAWLDLKGGLIDGDQIGQFKDPFKRAKMIHEIGWT